MLAVADRNIPQIEEAFAGICEVRTFSSAELTRENVRDADLLFTRSTVKVGPALLDGSRARFVATATIGIDHFDVPWLESRGLTWASAPGSNADSVLEWFASAILTLHARGALDLPNMRVGIVGVGNVGSRVEKFCRALGLSMLRCDPPRQAREGGYFVPLDEIQAQCDLVTLHVPLDETTRHFFDPRRMKSGAWLVNASRGEVIDENLLHGPRLVLDVFPHEPSPSPSLVAECALATPHIAGHSLEGKLNGTLVVYEAACRFLGIAPAWQPRIAAQQPITLGDGSDEDLLLSALRTRYRIENDDYALRQIAAAPDCAARFRKYRESYPSRRELTGTDVALASPRPRLAAALQALGARVR